MTTRNTFHAAVPILRVRNLEASLIHYTEDLGFAVDWQDAKIIAAVSRGPCNLMLAEGDQGNVGSWVWIGVGDVEALYLEYRRTGAKVRIAPTNYPWALELQIEDRDGNVLRFGSEPREGQPSGEWLDMRGDRWIKTAEGWTKKG